MVETIAAVRIPVSPARHLRKTALDGCFLVAIVLVLVHERDWVLVLPLALITVNVLLSLGQAWDMARRTLRLDELGVSWPYGGRTLWAEVVRVRVEPLFDRPRWLRRLGGYRFAVATPAEVDFARRLGRRPTGTGFPLSWLRTNPDQLAAAVRACTDLDVVLERR